MRVAYFDCFSGVSGDMCLGALLACGIDAGDLRGDLARLAVPGWRLDAESVSLSGIGATDVSVVLTEEPAHGRHLADIEHILQASQLPAGVLDRALAVFRRLADAEAKVHQTTPDRIHFHEVGAIDAIVDVVGTCILLDRLGVERVECSPLPAGHGFVRCDHGRIPVPAPAVLELTQGFPVYGVDVEGELVTPTGAAITTTLATRFGAMPPMTVRAAGYGAGKKRWPDRPNLLRVVIGDTADVAGEDEIAVIETNLDDLSPQFYEPLADRLFASGAVDVYLTAIQMKKGRPGTLLTVLAPTSLTRELTQIVFAETTTLGVRYTTMRRLVLEREWAPVDTAYGVIRIKVGRWAGEERTAAPEFEDVRAAAVAAGVPLKTVHQAALAAYGRRNS